MKCREYTIGVARLGANVRTDERFIRCIYVIDDYHVTRKGRNASENETCRLSHKMLAPRLQS